MTVNKSILDRMIRHGVYVERFKAHEVNEILAFLDGQVLPDVLKRIGKMIDLEERGFSLSRSAKRKLAKDLDAVETLIQDGFSTMKTKSLDNLNKFAEMEASFSGKILKEKIPNLFEFDFKMPSSQQLNSIITSRPMEGKVLKDWYNGLADGVGQRITQQINIGIAQGESIPEIRKRITGTKSLGYTNGEWRRVRNNTAAVVRTSVNHVNTHAREASYEANSDIVTAVMLVATLDTRTTEICMAYDGQTFPVSEGPRPPFHFSCRTTTTPILKSWQDLGFNLKEVPQSTRASMNGQVPEKITYSEWLREQPEDIQNMALGKGKAELFRDGVEIKDMLDQSGKTMTIDAIKKAEGIK